MSFFDAPTLTNSLGAPNMLVMNDAANTKRTVVVGSTVRIKADTFAGRTVWVVIVNGAMVREADGIVRFTSRAAAERYVTTHVEVAS